jgi:hypothetical protein
MARASVADGHPGGRHHVSGISQLLLDCAAGPSDGESRCNCFTDRAIAFFRQKIAFFQSQAVCASLCSFPASHELARERQMPALPETPRKADYAWTTLARMMSFAKDRGTISTNPCEKGGRLYVADRTDKFWGEQEIASLLSMASPEIKLAMVLGSGPGNARGTCYGYLGRRSTALISGFASPKLADVL